MKPLACVALPEGVVTETLTEPAECAGVVAVICVWLSTVYPVAAVPPNETPVAPVKLVPVRVTDVPPVELPLVGLILVMVGLDESVTTILYVPALMPAQFSTADT